MSDERCANCRQDIRLGSGYTLQFHGSGREKAFCSLDCLARWAGYEVVPR